MDPSIDVTTDEFKKYKMAFQILDKDNVGKISRAQFKEILTRAVGASESNDEIDAVLKEMNADENGDVNFQGFLKAMVAVREDDISRICCSAEDVLNDPGADKKKLLDYLGIYFTDDEITAAMNNVSNLSLEDNLDDDAESYETIYETTAGETSSEDEVQPICAKANCKEDCENLK